MSLYEHVFLARQDISAQQVDALLQDFRTIIEAGGGSIGKTEYWGVRSLSFRIKKNRKAHFTLMNLDAPHAAVAELERQRAEQRLRNYGSAARILDERGALRPGLSRDDAYILCSLAVDLHVTQNVDDTKGVHAMLPKSILH